MNDSENYRKKRAARKKHLSIMSSPKVIDKNASWQFHHKPYANNLQKIEKNIDKKE